MTKYHPLQGVAPQPTYTIKDCDWNDPESIAIWYYRLDTPSWEYKLQAPLADFFDFLTADHIDTHDPENRVAVVNHNQDGYYCYSREEYVEINHCSTYTYEQWLAGFMLSDWEKICREYLEAAL